MIKICNISFFIGMVMSCSLFGTEVLDKDWISNARKQNSELFYASHKNSDSTFFNPWMPAPKKGFLDLLKWKLFDNEEYLDEEKSFLPEIQTGLYDNIIKNERNSYAWLGHASMFFKISKTNIFIDPIISNRALVPRRKNYSALMMTEFEKLSSKSLTLITHNHYDHLDLNTLEKLPKNATIICPVGLKKYLEKNISSQIVELDWWQEYIFNDIKVVFVPAQHWSRRIWQKANSSLWGGYVIISKHGTIYNAGDTGFFGGFLEIKRRFSPIDLAVLPIGASKPRWFMRYAHMDPNDAVEAFYDLDAKIFFPVHWGTFPLGGEPVGWPALELKRVAKERGLANILSIPIIGKLYEYPDLKK